MRRREEDGGDPWDPGVALVDAGWKESAGQRRRAPFSFFFNLIGVHPCRGAGERRAERQH